MVEIITARQSNIGAGEQWSTTRNLAWARVMLCLAPVLLGVPRAEAQLTNYCGCTRSDSQDSVNLAQVGRQDVQFRAVFRYGAAGDDDVFFFQHPDHFLVRERFGGVFLFENVSDHVFDAGV